MEEVLKALEDMLVLHSTLNRGEKSKQYTDALRVFKKYQYGIETKSHGKEEKSHRSKEA